MFLPPWRIWSASGARVFKTGGEGLFSATCCGQLSLHWEGAKKQERRKQYNEKKEKDNEEKHELKRLLKILAEAMAMEKISLHKQDSDNNNNNNNMIGRSWWWILEEEKDI